VSQQVSIRKTTVNAKSRDSNFVVLHSAGDIAVWIEKFSKEAIINKTIN
jgi:hypothetical protein